MAEREKNITLDEFKYLIDSRNLSEKDKEAEREVLLKAREARFKSRSEYDRKVAKLMQLKYQMEEYVKNPECSSGPNFSRFLSIYVDTLYKKRKDFASDLSIDPVLLSHVLNNHRSPQETFIHRLILHSELSYKSVCDFRRDLWPRVFYQDKVCQFLTAQDQVRESEMKYITGRDIEPGSSPGRID